VAYSRTINQGYFGLGNAASGVVPANYTGPSGRYFEWIDSIANANFQWRITVKDPWSISSVVGFRYMDPSAYADSKVARDAESKNPDGTPVIRGLQQLGLTQLATGVIYDTRDNETFVTRGAYNQLAIEYVQGIPTNADVDYGEAQLYLCGYRPIGPFVLAGRLVGDFQFGHVPFYDLFMSGPYSQSEAIGGPAGVRGVPIGRYSGEIKIYGNLELRSMFLKFTVLKQKFSLGADALFDSGRSWLDWTFKAPQDGSGVGLKYGVGGGIYGLWGQSALFRIDVAYSPDAAAENPGFPVGIYVMDGTMF
jgi:outer membrane protein assembly factor BamA